MTATRIALLKVTLDDVKPAVLRRLQVPLTIGLDRLHRVLQVAMGWTDSHFYEIRARDVGWGLPDADFGDGPLDARKARLVHVLEDAGVKTIKYLLRLRRRLGAYGQDRAHHRRGPRPGIPGLDRCHWTLSA